MRNQDIGAIYHGFRAGSAVFTSHLLYNSYRRKQKKVSPNGDAVGREHRGGESVLFPGRILLAENHRRSKNFRDGKITNIKSPKSFSLYL